MLLIDEVWSESNLGDIFENEATIELILHSDDNIRTIKYIHGVYASAGAVFKVEGNMEQVSHDYYFSLTGFYKNIHFLTARLMATMLGQYLKYMI